MIGKLQIDEQTLIQNAILNIADNQNFCDSMLHIINICKQLLESLNLDRK